MVSDGGVPSGGVVEAFEVWSKTAYRAWFRVAKRSRCSSSVSRVAKNDSATALSYASPRRPIYTETLARSQWDRNAAEVY